MLLGNIDDRGQFGLTIVLFNIPTGKKKSATIHNPEDIKLGV